MLDLRSRLNHALAATCLTFFLSALLGCSLVTDTANISSDEQARVTSPNGLFDAVLLREDGGGAAGGWEWYMYIAEKGKPVEQGSTHLIFNAGTLIGAKLVWKQAHLLEIQYNIADINQFRNLWVGHQRAGDAGQDYLVEIRLAPTSQDFSLLKPDGTFKSKE
jgi:hypothetical protein